MPDRKDSFVNRFDAKIYPLADFFESYDEKGDLGKGRFGEVKLCVHKTTKKLCAAKFFCSFNPAEKANAIKEFNILKTLHHPNIIECLGAYETGDEFILVLEFVGGGELFEKVVAENFCLTEKDCQAYVRQICLALEYMHKQNVIHLDLKPENIMCVANSNSMIKVIDFGLAHRYEPGKHIKVLFGTPEFMAPEVVNYEEIDPNTDMWSLGVVTYVLLSGLSPFMGETTGETLNAITKSEYDFEDEEFDDVSEDAKDFIRKLLVKDKDKRMTSAQALKHPWLDLKVGKRRLKRINTTRHQKFLVHHRWQQAIGAIKTINMLKTDKLSPLPKGAGLLERRPSLLKNSRSETSLVHAVRPSLLPPKYVPPPINKSPRPSQAAIETKNMLNVIDDDVDDDMLQMKESRRRSSQTPTPSVNVCKATISKKDSPPQSSTKIGRSSLARSNAMGKHNTPSGSHTPSKPLNNDIRSKTPTPNTSTIAQTANKIATTRPSQSLNATIKLSLSASQESTTLHMSKTPTLTSVISNNSCINSSKSQSSTPTPKNELKINKSAPPTSNKPNTSTPSGRLSNVAAHQLFWNSKAFEPTNVKNAKVSITTAPINTIPSKTVKNSRPMNNVAPSTEKFSSNGQLINKTPTNNKLSNLAINIDTNNQPAMHHEKHGKFSAIKKMFSHEKHDATHSSNKSPHHSPFGSTYLKK